MKSITGATVIAAAALTFGLAGVADAAPASVQRESGPCYVHEFGQTSRDGKLFCSALNGAWESKAVHRAPKVRIGEQCRRLGAQAIVVGTDGKATCRETAQGLRWQW